MSRYRIGIVGNPNCGKTTLFNALTGARQRVGNWSGVTVDRKVGFYSHATDTIEVIDTPGIYSLSAGSVDEEVARDFLLSGEADLIVNIVDASNIERNLYLTSQLIEMELPLVIALNMMDVAKDKGIGIDAAALSERLGCPVIPMVASRERGVKELKDEIEKASRKRPVPFSAVTYPAQVEEAIKDLTELIYGPGVGSRWLAIKLLEDDPYAASMVGPGVLESSAGLQRKIEEELREDCDILIPSARYDFIARVTGGGAVTKPGHLRETLSDRIDKVVLNRILGIPIFLVAMYLMFLFVINIGGAFIDFFDILFGAIFVDGVKEMLTRASAPQWLSTILADGFGGGIRTMATFIPPIGFMFLCLSFLEDSGYMARAAFVMDRFMRFMGLPGKSFIPMLLGFGCNVPAIMATRTLENQRDRLLTIAMTPFMSCGARLPVYALFASAFFPSGGQDLVFVLYIAGIGAAVVTGLVLKKTLLNGEASPFIMELPPYHVPTFKSVVLRTYDRLQAFLFKAGKVLIPVIMVLAFLNSLGTDGSFGNEETPRSVLASVGRGMAPYFGSFGVSEENWPAAVGLFTGIFAKESVVGTLNSLYSHSGDAGDKVTGWDLLDSAKEAGKSVTENLKGTAQALLDPLGISMTGDKATTAKELGVGDSTFGAVATLFGSRAAAFAYLLFVLLYAPCSAATAAIYRETNLKWTIFVTLWTTFMAWFVATCFYQTATLLLHPWTSTLWIVISLGSFTTAVWVIHAVSGGKRRDYACDPPGIQTA